MRRLASLIFVAVGALGQVPDLTGEWRLMNEQSNFAKQAAPKFRILQIDHREPALIVRNIEERGEATLYYSTDGVERLNDVLGNPMQGKSRWDGKVLEMRTEGKFGTNEILLVDRYERDGSKLTLKRHFEGKGPNGAMPAQDQILVHELVLLRAGVARVDITPREPMAMYGYANRRCGPVSTGAHDSLWAKALVLESARERIGIVTFDLGSMVLTQALRDRVASELEIPVLLATASHTHSAPAFLPPNTAGAGFRVELEEKIFAALKQARASAAPARLRVGRGSAQLGYNRLVKREHGRSRAVFDNLERVPYGPVDPEFQLLEVTSEAGEPRALLIHYAVHPVVLGPTNCEYSADYPGVLQSTVEAAMPGVQAMFVQGGAGDINPLFLARKGVALEDFAQVTRMGELLAAEVLKSRTGMRRLEPASLPIRSKVDLVKFADRWDEAAKPHEVGVATVLIGREVAIAATPGEPMHKLQTMWKEQADVAFPLFYGYTNSSGLGWPGYVPDLKSAAYGGYGADVSTRVEVGAGESIMQRHLKNLYGLRGMWLVKPGQN